jgi:cardiolipin synthase (CMP-forming)
MTVPNLLTLSRILLTPLLVWLLVERKLNQALIVFFIAGMTDGLDGLIARLFKQKSRLGAILDPLADKLLLVSSLLILGHIGLIPGWLVVIAVARDIVIVTGTTLLIVLRYQVEMQPSLLGKLTTLMELLAVLLALSSSLVTVPEWIYSLMFAITAVFCLASGVQYVRRGIVLVQSQLMRTKQKP